MDYPREGKVQDGVAMVKITISGSQVPNFKNVWLSMTGWHLGANWLNLGNLFAFSIAGW